MSGRIKNILGAIYGPNVKYRYLKILGSIAFLTLLYILIFNVGYNKKEGVVVTPTDPKLLKEK